MQVLVVGASMAGLSAAYWFERFGASVTVIERCAGLRRGGAPIDVRGQALTTASRMGILDAVRAQRVHPTGPATVLGADGAPQASIDLTWFANESEDDVEISRDRLNDLIMASIGPRASFRFDTTITALHSDREAVTATASDGTQQRWDLVVGADGLHSTVRRLAFGPEEEYLRHLGLYVALADLDPTQAWQAAMYNVPGLMVAIRADGDVPLAYLLFRSSRLDYDYRDLRAQRAIVAGVLEGHRVWELPRLREALRDPDSPGFYFDSLSQTRMRTWSRGRVALIGDAAHCASLLSGMGTSLAMTAAEALAEEVCGVSASSSLEDMSAALRRFETRQRPLVDKAQHSIDDNGDMMVPGTTQQLQQRNAALRQLADVHASA